MNISRCVATTALLAGTAVAFAGLARADDLNGPYTVLWSDDSPASTWTFTPCGPGCSQVSGNKGWVTDAHLVDGRWIMGPIQSTVRCSNGGVEADTANGSFDALTLNGASAITYPVACPGDPPGGMTIHFNLVKSS